jgi:hypothetical protein
LPVVSSISCWAEAPAIRGNTGSLPRKIPLKRWAAWLDHKHPRPAKAGELHWCTTDKIGNEIEIDGRGPHLIDGKPVSARLSRRAVARRVLMTWTSDSVCVLIYSIMIGLLMV